MTKPREKTREELTAEIEEGKKKIRQFENREKIIKQKLSVEERKAKNHRAMQARRLHGVPCAGADCHAGRGRESLFTACLDERASTGVFEKTSRERERGIIPLNKGRTYTPLRACALCRGLISAQGDFPPRSDMAALPQQGAAPLRRFAAIPAHPQKQYTRLRVCTIFAGFIILAFCLDPETGFSWIGEYDITADELLSGAGGNTATKTEQAEKLILDLLADGKELASEGHCKGRGRSRNIREEDGTERQAQHGRHFRRKACRRSMV